MHYHTKNSEKLQMLREEPITGEEINKLPTSVNGLRSFTNKIELTARSRQKDWDLDRGKTLSIYYLVGDERRAARKLINTHPEFIKKCVEHGCNTPLSQLNDFMKDLVLQEYEIMEYRGEI